MFMGYLNQEEKTKEAVDENNWLHTGDVGKKDKAGFLSITGRIKGTPQSQSAHNIRKIFVQCRPNVEDVGPTLYKCYTNVLCLLGLHCCPNGTNC